MSYLSRILGLGVLLLALSLVVFVPLTAAHGVNVVNSNQQVASEVGMFQTTPTVTGTVTTTPDMATSTPTGGTGGAAQATSTPTGDMSGATQATATATGGAAGTMEATATATVGAAQQGGQQQTPGALPQTGGEITPWTNVALMVVGGLILAGGLSLALLRRSR